MSNEKTRIDASHEATHQEQPAALESRLRLLEQRFTLVDNLTNATGSLAQTVKELRNTLDMLLLENQELMETLAAIQQGRQIPKEPNN